eukprot:CAMPEP_0173364854 /NCGR_PEP_ID=MMETSP1144-20121109/23250_1 /TAXON_ID=483371 /ORGANISM="non described non described, Strain CCMP2298" /LENGTH=38 /DNA_ID= /DNA_START= /DNA_END= /DNA_ORIENTATION=
MGAEVGKPVSHMAITSLAAVTPTIEAAQMAMLKAELVK